MRKNQNGFQFWSRVNVNDQVIFSLNVPTFHNRLKNISTYNTVFKFLFRTSIISNSSTSSSLKKCAQYFKKKKHVNFSPFPLKLESHE